MLRKSIILLMLLVFSLPTLAQEGKARDRGEPSGKVETLHDLIGSDYLPRRAVISPDGTTIAWMQGQQLCFYDIAGQAIRCTGLPPDYRSETERLVWSPDSQQIAFTENFFLFFLEPDIRVYDVKSDSFQNLTDDHTYASILKVSDTTPIDVLPTWSPDNHLFFWRSFHEDVIPQTVYRFGADNMPVEVQNLTHLIPGPYSVYQQPVISPDGSTMAFIVRSPRVVDDPKNGVYTLDLNTGSVELIASIAQLHAGTPSWVDQAKAVPDAIYWSGTNLVVNMKANDFGTLEPANAIYIELPSKTLTPLFDYSQYATKVDYANAVDAGQPENAAILRSGMVSSDGKQYIFLHGLANKTVGFSSLPLPPDGNTPTALGISNTPVGALDPLNSSSFDGKRVLIDGNVLIIGQ